MNLMIHPKSKPDYLIGFTGFATLLVAIGLGRFGYPPLIPALVEAKWFSVAQADYLGAANLTGYIVGSLIGTRLNSYLPSVTLIRIMLATVILSFVLCAFHLGFPAYFLIRLFAGLAGGVLMVITAPTIFKHTAPDKKGVIGGIVFSGVGIGIVLAGTIIPLLVQHGLTLTWLCFAFVAMLLTLLSWNGWPQGSNQRHIKSEWVQSGRSTVWSGPVIFLIISYACNAIGFVPHTVFWVDFISRGLNRGITIGTQFWVLLGFSAAAGPLLTGYLADRIGFAKSIRISLLIKAIGVLLPLISTATWSLALSSIFVGSLALGITSLASGRTSELVANDRQKQVWSIMTIYFSLTHAATAYLLSFIFSRSHSYFLLFEIGAVALLIGSVLDYLAAQRK